MPPWSTAQGETQGKLLTVGTKIMITGGVNIGHVAVILGITEKMYNVRMDNQDLTRVKHCNAKAMSSVVALAATRSMPIVTPQRSSGNVPFSVNDDSSCQRL